MKKLYTLLLIAFIGFIGNAQIVTIPDANFKARLLAASTTQSIAYNSSGSRIRIDINNDGNIQNTEALLVYKLDVSNRSIADLTGIASFTNINDLTCSTNQLTSLNVTALTGLKKLYCGTNQLTSLNITGLTALETLSYSTNHLSNLDLSSFINLKTLGCSANDLTNINIAPLVNLTSLTCTNNLLTSLDVSHNTLLTSLNCNNNQLTSLSTTACTGLLTLTCNNNLITNLDLTNCIAMTDIQCGTNQLTTLNASNKPNLRLLYCDKNSLTSLNLSGDVAIEELSLPENHFAALDLSAYTSLKVLCIDNNPFTSQVNINGLVNLTDLFMRDVPAAGIPLTAANAPTFTHLQSLDTKNTPMGNFNYGLIPSLVNLQFINSGISTIDFTNLTNVDTIQCGNNQLTTLDLSPLIHLGGISFWNNPIDTLIFGNHPDLYLIYAGNNNLTDLDLSGLPLLNFVSTSNSPLLQTLNVKNGYNGTSYTIGGCPNLRYICADDAEITTIQDQITANAYTDCHVNTYCSFEPGGVFYTIKGNHRWDTTNNGCDTNDFLFPNMKFNISNGTTTTTLISGSDGSYRYDVPAGTYTVTPVLENASYYSVTPSNTGTIVFPTAANPYVRDFCIRSLAINPDLEVILYPLNNARPGIDSKFLLYYRNKGGSPQSGSVVLTYEDAIQDFISSTITPSSQAFGNLTWNYANLLPFEEKSTFVTFNLNSPTENPALTGGEHLHYNAAITGSFTDITPNDNTSAITRTVVNSLDPNDKTCIEGTTISPSMVGQYVHYIIRFENTGTANAVNVVVKDIIDTAKFDVTTLIPEHGSHPFITRIINTNKVEFVFENINLPFDDANNDGYVTFKIKTKPTLVLGDTFSNTANIYFDYNAPITTNTYTTTVATLGNQDFEFASVFSLSPVPAKEFLTITTKQNVVISSINIYNTLGQVVQIITNPSETLDVSNLKTGSYLIRIVSDKGTASSKFIKE